MSALRFVRRNNIDEPKWNGLITHAVNSLPYAFSWYLDAVAENWDALVLDDYAAVMPLVWLRKFGAKCLYQPYYCQQLGIFSRDILSKGQLKEFLDTAASKFPYIHINLNPLVANMSYPCLEPRKNLLLDLNKSYAQLCKSYNENHRRNIIKAEKTGMKKVEDIELNQFQNFYLENIDAGKLNFKPKHKKIFLGITEALVLNGMGRIYATLNNNEDLVAAALMIFHHNRIINIINTSSVQGKKNGAAHFLFDRLIRQLSGTESILDFEGSSIPGVARFYEGFGAQPEIFYQLRRNILQAPFQRLRGKI